MSTCAEMFGNSYNSKRNERNLCGLGVARPLFLFPERGDCGDAGDGAAFHGGGDLFLGLEPLSGRADGKTARALAAEGGNLRTK